MSINIFSTLFSIGSLRAVQNGMRLSCAAIKGGNVLWQDDLAELQKILQSLSEKEDYLKDKNAAIQKKRTTIKKRTAADFAKPSLQSDFYSDKKRD